MPLNLTGIGSYTEQNSGILLGRAILGADLLQYTNVQPGYAAGTVDINILNLGQLDYTTRACGWPANGGGTVSYERVSVTVRNRQQKSSLCLQDLRGAWLSAQMNPSGFSEEYPLEQWLADQMVLATRLNFEQTLGTDIIAGMTASNGVTTVASAGWTVSTIFDSANNLIDNLPSGVRSRDDLHMYMSYPVFRNLSRALVQLNYFNYPVNGTTNYGSGLGQHIIFPGTNIKCVPVAGLQSSNRVFLGPKEHLVVVTGLTDDQDKLEIWYSKDNDEIRTLSAYRAGIGAVYSSFVQNGQA